MAPNLIISDPHALTKSDIGKKIIRQNPSVTAYCEPDYSYTGEIYTLVNLESNQIVLKDFHNGLITIDISDKFKLRYADRWIRVKDYTPSDELMFEASLFDSSMSNALTMHTYAQNLAILLSMSSMTGIHFS